MAEVIDVHVPERSMLDVVFLHGLDGDARKTWTGKGEEAPFWPAWLAEDLEGVAVWSVGYEAWSSGWRGRAMPMQDRAVNLMAQLQNLGIGQRPLCFVTHSMGGLLAKEILLHAAEGRTDYASFATAARGVVFLGTPHTGSGVPAAVEALKVVYRATHAVKDLRRDSAHLRQLNDRYRDWASESGIANLVFFEAYPIKGVWVVDKASANPGLPHVRPIPVDADHIGICKVTNRRDLVYGQVKRFLADILSARVDRAPPPASMGDPPGGTGSTIAQPVSQARASRTLVEGSLPPLAHSFLTREQTALMASHLEAGRSVVLTGPGGVGKSQIASAYARSVAPNVLPRTAPPDGHDGAQEQLDLVVWVDAAARSAVLSTYAQAYAHVVASRGSAGPSALREPGDQEAAAGKFVNWLSTTERSWLVVLDGAPSLGEIAGLLPEASPSGRVVVTTRCRDAAWLTDSRMEVPVSPFSPEQARTYLRDALRHPRRQHLDTDEELAELAAALGHLPVGLSHAAAYLIDDDRAIPSYLEDLHDRTVRLSEVMPARTGLPDEYPQPLDAMWDISLDHADQTPPEGLARPVLHLAALLDGQTGIPEELFKEKAVAEHAQAILQARHGQDATGETAAVVRERDVRAALRILHRLHLMDHEQGLVRMHHLLQKAVREHETTRAWAEAAVEAAGSALVHVWVQKPSHDELHVRRMLAAARELQTNDTGMALWRGEIPKLGFLYGTSLVMRGSALAALTHFKNLLTRAEERFDPQHPTVLLARVLVADCRGHVGDPLVAVADLRAVLANMRHDGLVDSPLVGHVLQWLANWQLASARPAEAMATLTEALDYVEDEEEILAIEHNLAVQRCESGDTRDADLTFRKLVKRKARLLGEDHPETLASRHERARWRGHTGRPNDMQLAEAEMRRVFRARQRVLGPAHPDTLRSQQEVAHCQIENGDRAGGVKELETVISLRTQHFGPDAPDTLLSRLSLATVRAEVMTDEAIDSLAILVREIDRTLGEGHPTRLLAHRNLKAIRQAQRRSFRVGSIVITPNFSTGLHSMWNQTPSRADPAPDTNTLDPKP
ncbi:hypothetical protein [Streptomyces althioticus]|uniref:hypothetical protein n=1 Tax=Streptomyces althioticus TaxID=83380 RepID=UPI0037AC7079